MRVVLALGLALLGSNPLHGQSAGPNAAAPRPEIREIDQLVRNVDLQIRNGRLSSRDSSGYCELSGDTISMQYFADTADRTRRAIVQWSIRHYGQSIEYTYDTQGKVRYAKERRIGPDSSEASLEGFWRPDGTLILLESRIVRLRMYPWDETRPLVNPRFAVALFCRGD